MPTTITIDPQIRDRLKTYGMAGQTYNEILTNLMAQVDRERFLGELRRIARRKTGWVGPETVDWS